MGAPSPGPAWLDGCRTGLGAPGRSRRGLEILLQFREDLEQIADESYVGDLEDRRVRIRVDGDDRAGVLDAGKMLDRPRDAHRDIETRGNDFAGLPHLQIVGDEAGVHRRARGPYRRAQLVGQTVDDLEVLARADAAPPGYHPRCTL